MGYLLLLVLLIVAGLMVFSFLTARRIELGLPPEGRFITIMGNRIHYVEQGSGPRTVLLVHGLTGVLQNFTYAMLGELARDCRVIAIDRPGSGYSKRPLRSSASLAVQADVIAGLIDALQLDRPVVVGHSLGGAVALAAALRHPDKISALALIAPLSRMPAGGPPGIFASLRIRWHWLRWLFAWTLMLPLAARQRERIMQTAFGPEAVPAHFALRGGGAQAMRPSNYIAASRDLVALEPVLPRLQEGYEDLQLPVHILYGWGDRILDPQEQGRVLADQLPKGELELVEGGHMLPLTQPQRCVEFVRRTLQQTAG
ncbi:Pimeloyl-ACP methyl ester carboxylesterase [Halopseudomonas formosensis]|uniref:Pimeloyl-ACP methyl ester carboxylesterase n=1 Tax=Halopseudomonas formosensis TaxID=1002526 RepID=A0A1I6AFG0_9GAMM|nr:alpha/beta hydrolase [Halopseudomonas formosensis]SFQ67343.1 Pimeloyl-ACP methyl ester carboxylesterase [Halopseudomonas formosensis]